jgi:Phosphotransferase enzyme family
MIGAAPSVGPPDLQALSVGLARALGNGGSDGAVAVLGREPVSSPGWIAVEVITCQFADGGVRRLLGKYGGAAREVAHGHRGGVPYEAAVYARVLGALHLSPIAFYGAYEDAGTGATWLFLEYVDGSTRMHDGGDADALGRAAAWIGRFHASTQPHVTTAGWPEVPDYDETYYRGWVVRTAAFAGPLAGRFPWLARLCQRWDGFVAPLLAAGATLIHGEYYPKNVLVRDGRVYPIDWETTAIGAGEIDLASLTEHWPADIVRECQVDYRRARWPKGPPADFERTLAAARLYLHFRWLGDRPEWTTRPKWVWRFEEMRHLAERLDLI